MLNTMGELQLAVGRPRVSAEGAFRWANQPPVTGGFLTRVRSWLGLDSPAGPATVFHITHQKAGSQWINRILHALVYDRLVVPEPGEIDTFDREIRPGAVYPTVYVTREQFERLPVPKNSRWFVVIRDLRDTVVSAYFSIKHSHAMEAEEHLRMRNRLRDSSFDDGLLYLLDTWLPDRAAVQRSWLSGPDDVLRYEELLRDDLRILERVLLGHCRLAVTPEKFREVVLANQFEARAGRKRGEEDVSSHERKGIAGDWRNHFSDRVAKEFKSRFGELLVQTGYEQNSAW